MALPTFDKIKPEQIKDYMQNPSYDKYTKLRDELIAKIEITDDTEFR